MLSFKDRVDLYTCAAYHSTKLWDDKNNWTTLFKLLKHTDELKWSMKAMFILWKSCFRKCKFLAPIALASGLPTETILQTITN